MNEDLPATESIGLRGLAAVLPYRMLTLSELAAEGRLRSDPETLRSMGFENAYVAGEDESACDLALRAARGALADAGLEPGDIDMLNWVSALPANHLRPTPAGSNPDEKFLRQFAYAGSWLQDQLGLDNASLTATSQQGCAGMFNALRNARALLLAEPDLQHILCVGVDVLPPTACREILYNVMSDAACAVVVSKGCLAERWIGFHQVTKGYYWNVPAMEKEIIAAYFPTSGLVLREILRKTELTPEQIAYVIPTGVNERSWPILLRLAGIPEARLYQPARRFGHTIAADNFLFLEEIRKRKAVPKGSRLLLFTYGFGSTWSALVLEH